MRRAGAAFIAGMCGIYLSVDRISALEVAGSIYKMPGRWCMGDAAGPHDASKHRYKFPSALQLPRATTLTGNAALQQDILTDLQFRIHEVEDLRKEIDRLKGLNVSLTVRNFDTSAAPPAAPAEPAAPAAAPAGAEAARIADLEGQLQAAVEENRLQKETWDAEKLVFEANVVASAPASTVAVQAVAGGTDEVAALKDEIEQQQVDIEHLTDRVRIWRKRCGSRASSTTSNTLHDLLLKLQRVLRLPFDDPDAVYEAVAEAIYAHSTPAQRHQIDDAPSDKYEFIDYLVELFKVNIESSDTSDSASESDEADASEQAKYGVDRSTTDGIAPAVRPKSAQKTPRAERPESARANNQNERQGYASRAATAAGRTFKSVVNRVTGIRSDKATDMSSLLSDLKHVSENGSSFTNNIGSVDADTPPT